MPKYSLRALRGLCKSASSRKRDPQHVQGQTHDVAALEREHHDDGEEQCDERDGCDPRHEGPVVPLAPLHSNQRGACEEAGDKGDAEVNENTLCDLTDGDVDLSTAQAEPDRKSTRLNSSHLGISYA